MHKATAMMSLCVLLISPISTFRVKMLGSIAMDISFSVMLEICTWVTFHSVQLEHLLCLDP